MNKLNKNKSGYKETKIGLIPDDWEYDKLRNISYINQNSLNDKTSPEYCFKYLDLASVTYGKIDKSIKEICFFEAPGRARRLIKENDILLATVRPNLKGFAYIDFDGTNYIASTGYAVITPNENHYAKFIYHNLFSKYTEKYFDNCVVGSNYPALTNQDVEDLIIPLPPLPEQKKIADILSTWDRAIEKTEKLVDAKIKFKKGLMQQLLTGQKRFKEFNSGVDKLKKHKVHEIHKKGIPEGWKSLKMIELFEQIKGTDDDLDKPKVVMTISGKYGFLSQNDKFNRVIAGSSLQNYIHLKKGEFAYNRGNSKTYRFGCVYKLEIEEGLVPNIYICFKSKTELSEDFYKFYFEHGLIESQLHRIISSSARGDGLLNVSSQDFFKIKVLYPPIKEQQRIASVLSTIDKEISTLNKKLNALKQQKKGLMQKLLTGEVRVKV